MNTTKYFSDVTGSPVALTRIGQMRNADFAARFPGVRGRRIDGYYMLVGWADGATLDSQTLPVTRAISFKAFPSRHECNAKCMGGKVNGTCECQCGGKNHGAGMFTQLLAAA